MSKYTRGDLRKMAREALAARDNGDMRWTMLLFAIAYTRDIPEYKVEAMI